MEVDIRKAEWRRAWRYPAYLWSPRWDTLSKKFRRLVYAVYPRIPPPQYTTACSGWPVHMLTELWTGSGLNISEIRTQHPPESARMAVTRLRALSAVASCSPVLTTARSRSWPEAAEVTPPLGPPRSLCYLLARPPASSSSRLRCSYYNRNPDDFRCQRVSPRQLLCVAMISIWPRIGLSASTIHRQ